MFSYVSSNLKVLDTDWNYLGFIFWYLFLCFSNCCCGMLKRLWALIWTKGGLKNNCMIIWWLKRTNNKTFINSQQINNLISVFIYCCLHLFFMLIPLTLALLGIFKILRILLNNHWNNQVVFWKKIISIKWNYTFQYFKYYFVRGRIYAILTKHSKIKLAGIMKQNEKWVWS